MIQFALMLVQHNECAFLYTHQTVEQRTHNRWTLRCLDYKIIQKENVYGLHFWVCYISWIFLIAFIWYEHFALLILHNQKNSSWNRRRRRRRKNMHLWMSQSETKIEEHSWNCICFNFFDDDKFYSQRRRRRRRNVQKTARQWQPSTESKMKEKKSCHIIKVSMSMLMFVFFFSVRFQCCVYVVPRPFERRYQRANM